jgi:hypothetical protein
VVVTSAAAKAAVGGGDCCQLCPKPCQLRLGCGELALKCVVLISGILLLFTQCSELGLELSACDGHLGDRVAFLGRDRPQFGDQPRNTGLVLWAQRLDRARVAPPFHPIGLGAVTRSRTTTTTISGAWGCRRRWGRRHEVRREGGGERRAEEGCDIGVSLMVVVGMV